MVTSINTNCEGCRCVKVDDDYQCLKTVNGTNIGCNFRGFDCPECRNCGLPGRRGSSSSVNSRVNSYTGEKTEGAEILDSFKKISKISCTDSENTCNFRPPFSELSLESINPSTGENYTELEKGEKIGQFKNMCSLRSDNNLNRCCDPNDDTLNNINNVPESFREEHPLFVQHVIDGKTEYKTCKNRTDPGCESAITATTYNYCKMLHPSTEYDETTSTFSNLANDCVTANCSNESLYPFISDPYSNKFTNYEDFNLVENIKKDNVDALIAYFVKNSTTKYSAVLKYGYPGNTALHECIVHKAKKCINELLKKTLNLSIKNKDGNTVLHLACLDGNTNLIHELIKKGADINIRNNDDDVAIHCAVRSGGYGPVMILISNGASLFQVNKKKETPLFIAVTSQNQNVKLVELLVQMGSHLLTINSENKSMLKVLEERKKTMTSEQIRTLIQRFFYEQNKTNYVNIIKTYPEYSIIDMDQFLEKDEDGEVTGVKELPDLTIEYPDEFETKNLYKERDSKPIKINMPQYKELYGNEVNENTKYSLSEVYQNNNVVSEETEDGQNNQENNNGENNQQNNNGQNNDNVIETFEDFNKKNVQRCRVNWIIIPILFAILLVGLLFLKQ